MTNWKRQSHTNKVLKIFANIFRKLLHTNYSIVMNDISIKFFVALRYQFVFPNTFVIAKEDIINYILRSLWKMKIRKSTKLNLSCFPFLIFVCKSQSCRISIIRIFRDKKL